MVLVGFSDLLGSFLRFWYGHSRAFSGVLKPKFSKCPFGGVLFLSETITARLVVSCLMIMGGILSVILLKKKI